MLLHGLGSQSPTRGHCSSNVTMPSTDLSKADFWNKMRGCASRETCSLQSHQQYYVYKSNKKLLKLKFKQENEFAWSPWAAKRKGNQLRLTTNYKGPQSLYESVNEQG